MSAHTGSPPADVYKRLQTRLGELYGRRDITDVVSFRIPLYIKMIYNTFDRETKRRVSRSLEKLILALAGLSQPPEPNQPIIINLNINEARAEAKPQININIDVKALEDMLRLLEFLYNEASKNMTPKTRRILEQRVKRAERLLEDLMVKLN